MNFFLKYLIILSLQLLLFATVSMAGVVQQKYTFDHYRLFGLERGYESFSLDNCHQYASIGNPEVPWIPVVLALPFGTRAVSWEVRFTDEVIVPGQHTLLPYQGVQPYSLSNASVPFHVNEAQYKSNTVYPHAYTKPVQTHYLNGYGIAVAGLTPVRYIPAAKQLSYYRTVTVTLHTESGDERAQYAMLSPHKETAELAKNVVKNPELIDSYPGIKADDEDYQMLIITGSGFKASFDELIAYYATKKIVAKAVDIPSVLTRSHGRDTQEKIRSYIIQEYKNSKIRYVLLGGDVQVLPERRLYCEIMTSDGLSYKDDLPADLYYASLDGTWNKNNNTKWGEIADQDSIDLFPDIAVGRLPFQNDAESKTLLGKNLSYQKSPVLTEVTKPLLFGEYLDEKTLGRDALKLLIGHHEEDGFVTDGIPKNTNTIAELYETRENEVSKSQVSQKINAGTSFIYHDGHANYTILLKYMSLAEISDNTFQTIDGKTHNYALLNTVGCMCGGFDKSDCIAEKMMKIKTFLVAFIGNSRYGLYNQGKTEGPSSHLMREFVNGIYGKGKDRIGDAFLHARVMYAPYLTFGPIAQVPDSGGNRWGWYTCNLLGDPAMTVWYKEGQTAANPFDPLQTTVAAKLDVKRTAGGVRITFSLPDADDAEVSIFNSRGQCIQTITRAMLDKGIYARTWDGTNHNGLKAGAGCYYARVRTGRYTETRAFELTR